MLAALSHVSVRAAKVCSVICPQKGERHRMSCVYVQHLCAFRGRFSRQRQCCWVTVGPCAVPRLMENPDPTFLVIARGLQQYTLVVSRAKDRISINPTPYFCFLLLLAVISPAAVSSQIRNNSTPHVRWRIPPCEEAASKNTRTSTHHVCGVRTGLSVVARSFSLCLPRVRFIAI